MRSIARYKKNDSQRLKPLLNNLGTVEFTDSELKEYANKEVWFHVGHCSYFSFIAIETFLGFQTGSHAN